MHRHLKRILTISGTALALLIFILALALIIIQTNPGQRFLEKTLNDVLVWEEGKVSVSGISGRIPFNMEVDSITVEDTHGPWLKVDQVSLHWSLSRLFSREIHVFEVGAHGVDFTRLPLVKPKQDDDISDPSSPTEIQWKWPLPPLTVENLFLDNVHISDEILEEDMILNARATLFADRKGFSLANLDINRLDQPSSIVSLSAELSRNPYFLDLNLTLSDPGMLPALTGLEHWPRKTSATLKGSGPLSSWKGRLDIKGEKIIDAGLDLQIQEQEFYHLMADGNFFINPVLLPEEAFGFTRDPFNLLLNIGLDRERQIVLEHLTIDSPLLALKSKLRFNPENMNLSGDAQLNIEDINPLLMDSGMNSREPLDINLSVDGPVKNLIAHGQARLGPVSGHGVSLDETTLSADLSLNPTLESMATLKGRLYAAGIGLEQYANLPENFNLRFNLDYSHENILKINSLDLAGEDIESKLTGEINTGSMDFKANLKSFARNLEKLIPGFEKKPFFMSNLELGLDVQGNFNKPQYLADLELSFPEFRSDEEFVTAIAGPDIAIKASAVLDQNMDLSLSQASINAAGFNFQSSGMMGFKSRKLDFSGQFSFPALSILDSTLSRDISGSLDMNFSALGSMDEVRVEATTNLNSLNFDPIKDMNIGSHVYFYLIDNLPAGNFDMYLQREDKHLDLFTDFQVTEDKVQVNKLIGRGPGIDIHGNLLFDIKNTLTRGKLNLDLSDMAMLGDFFNIDLAGSARSELTLYPTNEDQDVDFVLEGNDIRIENIYAEKIKASGRARQIMHQPGFESQIHLNKLRASQAEIESFEANIHGTLKEIFFSQKLTGNILHHVELSSDGSYALEDEMHKISLTELQGSFAYEPFTLLSPVILSHSPQGTSISPLDIKIASGNVQAKAELDQDKVHAKLNLSELNISEIPVPGTEHISGIVNLDLELLGTPTHPEISATLNVDDLAPSASELEDLKKLNLNSTINVQGDQLNLDASLMENSNSLLKARFDAPLEFSITPFTFTLPDPVPLSGTLVSRLNLEKISAIFLPPDQILSGIFDAELKISGTSKSPDIEGPLKITQASYENVEAGIFLTDLEIMALAKNTIIDITRIYGSDGINGNIQGQGKVDIDPAGEMPWNMELNISNTRILNHKFAVATISKGNIAVSGDNSGGEARGKITFDRILTNLPDAAPPDIVHLEVTEINLPHDDKIQPQEKTADNYPFQLDIELDFPARVYVRGRGLDSEWGGNISIKGDASSPAVSGRLQVIRGRLNLLDRRFDLVPESYINLDGSFPPDPGIDINANMRQKDINVNVRVFGPALSPDIVFTSDPPMPEDEIMAWILFGRDISTLTPFQAIGLVDATRTLTMGDSGPGVMDTIKSITGIDDLDVTRDEHGHAQFGLGKYINEKVYIEVKKGTVPGSDTVSVQVELTPHINLESSVDSDSEGGVGIFWKHDY
ncbi:MAG: translocation/assembly module TamB domain-containing protein [Desulfonatronovibrio sp.]